MKKKILVPLLLWATFLPPLSISIYGEESGTYQIVEISKPTSDRSLKPKAPSRQAIYCYYDGNSLYFSFAYSEGDCDLTVSSAAGLQYYTFSSEEPEAVYIGAVSLAYITVVTEAGNTYVGKIE